MRALQERASTGNARFDALVVFTRAVILTRGKVAKGELADFVAAGFTEQQVLEVILGVSLATLCNFANNLAGTDINWATESLCPGGAGIMNTIIRTQDDALAWASAHAASLNEAAPTPTTPFRCSARLASSCIGVPVELGGTGGSTWDAPKRLPALPSTR